MKKLNIDKNWYNNKNVKPKDFICHISYSPRGEMRIKKVFVKNKVNQHEELLQTVDVRDFKAAVNTVGVSSY